MELVRALIQLNRALDNSVKARKILTSSTKLVFLDLGKNKMVALASDWIRPLKPLNAIQ